MAQVTPDLARARRTVLDLLAIPGLSGEEKAVADHVAKALRAAGCPAAASEATPTAAPIGERVLARANGAGVDGRVQA